MQLYSDTLSLLCFVACFMAVKPNLKAAPELLVILMTPKVCKVKASC